MPCFQENPGPPYFPSNSDQAFPTQAECEETCSELGACCRGEVCTQEKKCDCQTKRNGQFQGVGVPCDPDPCECVIKRIESVEVTIEAEDFAAERLAFINKNYPCRSMSINEQGNEQGNEYAWTTFFPGASYAGTYSLTRISPQGNFFRYAWTPSGQVCGGYIDFAPALGGMLLRVSLNGINFHDILTQSLKPASELTCETIDPVITESCLTTTLQYQFSCEIYFQGGFDCLNDEINFSGRLPLTRPQNAANCTRELLARDLPPSLTIDAGEVRVTNIEVTYAE